MRRFLIACAAVAWASVATPALGSSSPPLQATSGSSCAKKRTDACGCHHHYGLRHCHPKLKTPRCEAPVKAQRPLVPLAPQALPGDRAHVSL